MQVSCQKSLPSKGSLHSVLLMFWVASSTSCVLFCSVCVCVCVLVCVCMCMCAMWMSESLESWVGCKKGKTQSTATNGMQYGSGESACAARVQVEVCDERKEGWGKRPLFLVALLVLFRSLTELFSLSLLANGYYECKRVEYERLQVTQD